MRYYVPTPEACAICGDMVTETSFRFGYGSVHDGECVCWNCAAILDHAVDGLILARKTHSRSVPLTNSLDFAANTTLYGSASNVVLPHPPEQKGSGG